tara:strand:- start:228 stop:680 length:453 start_codon:yes stop_codon:yes gene_type:complete
MSGIIGGAGSKSGVIGTTEIDYEEGTWTPDFEAAGGGSMGATVQGHYTKIGNTVFYSAIVDITSTVSGYGAVNLKGWPFSAITVTNNPARCRIAYKSSDSTLQGYHSLEGQVSGVSMRVSYWSRSSGAGNAVSTRFPNGTKMWFSGHYIA